MSNKERENKGKSKAIALTMVVSMIVANPLFETGCTKKAPRYVVDEEQMKEEEEQQSGGSGTHIVTGGGHSTPFIFRSSTSTGSGETISNGSWKSWTAPSTTIKGGYSGVHLSGSSS